LISDFEKKNNNDHLERKFPFKSGFLLSRIPGNILDFSNLSMIVLSLVGSQKPTKYYLVAFKVTQIVYTFANILPGTDQLSICQFGWGFPQPKKTQNNPFNVCFHTKRLTFF